MPVLRATVALLLAVVAPILAVRPAEADDEKRYHVYGKTSRVDAREVLDGGASVENPVLEPGDVSRVPKARVTIAGEVRRPGSYELQPQELERLEDLIAAAGGPTAMARVSRIELRRAARPGEKAERRTIDLENPQQDELQRNPVLRSGDHVIVPSVRHSRSPGINEVYQIGILVLTLIGILVGR